MLRPYVAFTVLTRTRTRNFLSLIHISKNANLEPQVLKNALDVSGATVVLDVGANVGQFGDMVFAAGFKGKVVSFEAIRRAHQQLAVHAEKSGHSWSVAPCAAIGSSRGQIEVNISANSVSSSILPMKHAHLEAAPQSHYVESQTVGMERLDEIAAPLVSATAKLMIKVDTQGYELEVLKGATGLLPQTVALQLELSLVALYEGAPTLVEMISYAQSQGFELFSIVPGFWDIRNGRSLQVDGFFVRKGLLT